MVKPRHSAPEYLRCKRWTIVALVTVTLAIRMVSTVRVGYELFGLNHHNSFLLTQLILSSLSIVLLFTGLCLGVLRHHLGFTVGFALVSLGALFGDLVTAFQQLLSAINVLLMLVITILTLLYIQDLVFLRRRRQWPLSKPTKTTNLPHQNTHQVLTTIANGVDKAIPEVVVNDVLESNSSN